MNVVEQFLGASEKYPNNTAIIDSDRTISFKDLRKEVIQTASYFQSKGIQKGDRILVFVPMSIDLYRTVLAIFHCGATAVFLDEWVSKKRMEVCCKIANCKGFIAGRKIRMLSIFSSEIRQIPIKLKLSGQKTNHSEMTETNTDDPALITFTTGSTGTPKAANRTHGFLLEQFNVLVDVIQPKPEDVDMPMLPIVLFMNLGVGSTSFIPKFKMKKIDKMDFSRLSTQMSKLNVNRISSSPIFIEKLALASQNNSVEKIFTGGAPIFPSQAKLFQKGFSKANISVVYGTTEVEPISYVSSKDLLSSEELSTGLLVGKPYDKSEVKILIISDDIPHKMEVLDFESNLLNDGQIGEIIVAGPHVLKRYFNNEEAFQQNKIIVEGKIWHRTGDSGFLKHDQLFLTGRCKQLIFRNNAIISPFIIENQLLKEDDISMGTILEIKGKLTLILESNNRNHSFENILYDEIIYSKIPRDPRHQSKIDYESLKIKLLN